MTLDIRASSRVALKPNPDVRGNVASVADGIAEVDWDDASAFPRVVSVRLLEVLP